MSSCSQLRAKGREILGYKLFSKKWLFALLASLIVSGISSVSTSFLALPIIIAGPLGAGLCTYYLQLKREGTETNLKSLFSPFTTSLGRNIGAGAWYCIIVGLYVVSFCCFIGASVYFPPFILCAILVYILVVLVSIKYSMLFCVLADHPEYRVFEALRESVKLIQGYRWKYFKLQLSFFGWSLLASLTFGIGNLWLQPYMQATTVAFYEELKEIKFPTVEVASAEEQ